MAQPWDPWKQLVFIDTVHDPGLCIVVLLTANEFWLWDSTIADEVTEDFFHGLDATERIGSPIEDTLRILQERLADLNEIRVNQTESETPQPMR